MKTNPIFSILLFGLLVTSLSTLADENLSDKIKDFETYYQENYQELIYVQVDKGYYLTGEQIKLKVFCIEATKQQPSKLSKVAYVEVLDAENTSKLQARILLKDGIGYGEIYIPTNMLSANYILRGYTRWMKNLGPDSYFHSMTTIVNPFRKLGLLPKPNTEDVTVKFYPESGKLIDGVESKVVFEGKDSNGGPTSLCGRLLENDNTIVAELCTEKNGMGKFTFTPDLNKRYRLEITQSGGVSTSHNLPQIHGSGTAIVVKEKGGDFEIRIHGKGEIYNSDSLFFLIHSRGKIVNSKNVILKNNEWITELERDMLPYGVSTFTLFSSDGKALNSRSFFKANEEQDLLKMNLSKKSFSAREKVRIDISSLYNDLSIEGMNLAVSVASHHEQFESNQLSLPDYLSFGQSLSRLVYAPETLSDDSESPTKEAIDQVLIAHAKDQFIWQNIAQKEDILYIPEFQGPILTGKISIKETKEPAVAIITYLSVPGKNIQFFASKSRNDGSFAFELDDVYGNNEIVIQNDYTKDTIYSINLDEVYSQEYAEINIPPLDLDEEMEKWIMHQSQNMQVENANQKFQPQLPLLTSVDSSSFYFEPDSRYYLDDFTRFIVMEEVMREYVYGVNVRINKQGYHFMVLDLERNEMYRENPLMLLDGIPVFDANEIIALDPLKVEKIETVKSRYHKGHLDCRGIVTYTTYKGDLNGYELHNTAMVIEYEGVQPMKQYYFPEYPSSSMKRTTTPDFRNTLYWNPEIQLDENGKATIEFYTSDDLTNYEVRVMGMSKSGKSFSKKGKLQVSP